jgi:hypothetical protein
VRDVTQLRRLFNVVSAFSLLLYLAVAGLLMLGERHVLLATVSGERWAITFGSHDRGLWTAFRRNDDDADHLWQPGFRRLSYFMNYDGPPRNTEELAVLYRPRVTETFVGFGFQPDHDLNRRNWIVRVPSLAMVVMLATCPLYWAVSHRKRLGTSHPACAACGYDLRATPERCPECGTISAQAGPATT